MRQVFASHRIKKLFIVQIILGKIFFLYVWNFNVLCGNSKKIAVNKNWNNLESETLNIYQFYIPMNTLNLSKIDMKIMFLSLSLNMTAMAKFFMIYTFLISHFVLMLVNFSLTQHFLQQHGFFPSVFNFLC